jgi:hypothetical protein
MVSIRTDHFYYGRVTAIEGDRATVHVVGELDEWGYPSTHDVTPHDVTVPLADCHPTIQ